MDENKFDECIQYWAAERGLPWLLVKAQVAQESSFNSNAKSSCGARGLMQLMPAMMIDMGESEFSPEATFDDLVWVPEWNIETGTKYDKWLYERFPEIPGGAEKYKFMLAAYNCGRGYVNVALQLARFEEFGFNPLAARPGKWQTWDFACRLLASDKCYIPGPGKRTMPDFGQVLNYVDRVWKRFLAYRIEEQSTG